MADIIPTYRTGPARFGYAVLFVAIAVASMVITFHSGIAQSQEAFPALRAGQRVYDVTGTSLTPAQSDELELRLLELETIGANTIVYVRELNASPDETLNQVEALQQAWVAETGVDQDTAVAILINRNPNDPYDARAGIYVGRTFNDGNVPRDEQRAIVNDELIPPLRDGDVYGSLSAGLDRLASSIVNGPPQTRFERWASEAGASWLPWIGVGAAILGFAFAWMLFQRRQLSDLPDQEPTIIRPGTISPALAGALVAESPQASAIPATLLELAGRGALSIELESEGGRFTQPKAQFRLVDSARVENNIEAAIWLGLEKRVENGIVSSKAIQKTAADSRPVRKIIEGQMVDAGWIDEGAKAPKFGLVVIVLIAAVMVVFGIVVAAQGGQWLPVVGIVPLAALGLVSFFFYHSYSSLSTKGQEAAIPWKAYRNGIKNAAKNEAEHLDLDAVLADSVAMNIGSDLNKRLKAAGETGIALRVFSSTGNQAAAIPVWMYWTAFNSSASTVSGSGTVSGGGAGGGGGAAGST